MPSLQTGARSCSRSAGTPQRLLPDSATREETCSGSTSIRPEVGLDFSSLVSQTWRTRVSATYVLLGLLLGFDLFLGQRAHVVNQVPVFFDLHPLTLRRHIVMPVLDDVENLAIGTVFERRGIGKVGNTKLHVLRGFAFAVAVFAVAHDTIQRPPFLGAGDGLRAGLHRIRLLHGLNGDCRVGGSLLRRRS